MICLARSARLYTGSMGICPCETVRGIEEQEITKDEIIAAIQAQKAEYGQAKSSINRYLNREACKRFGSWQEACEAAGVKPCMVKKITRKAREDCRFIADDYSDCEALKALYCLREDCVFFKPK